MEKEKKEDGEPGKKRQRLDPDFNASGAKNNDANPACEGRQCPWC